MMNRLFFCLRRLLFVYSIYQLYENQLLQILILFYTNLFMSCYKGYFKPLIGRKQNQIELFNEFMISCISYFLVLYTEMVDSESDKYFYGWIQVALVSFTFLINLFLIFFVTINQMRFLYFKVRFYFMRGKRYLVLKINKRKNVNIQIGV